MGDRDRENSDYNKMGAGARIEKAVLDIAGTKVTAAIKEKIERGVNMTRRRANSVAGHTKDRAQNIVFRVKLMVYNSIATLLTFVLIIALSFFFYGTFYYAYMPLQVHEQPVNLQFDPCDDSPGVCSYPNASIQLNNKIKLMAGQSYSISLKLEVPESASNQKVGMFMSCMKIQKQDSSQVTSCQSSILEFRSQFLIYLETIVFSPFLVSGTSSQRQWVNINYFQKFFDDPHNPATKADLQIQSKFLQVYSATILIHAEFSGLRHIIYYHPWISTSIGVAGNFILLSTIILISWSRIGRRHRRRQRPEPRGGRRFQPERRGSRQGRQQAGGRRHVQPSGGRYQTERVRRFGQQNQHLRREHQVGGLHQGRRASCPVVAGLVTHGAAQLQDRDENFNIKEKVC